MSCELLSTAQDRIELELTARTAQQETTANADAIGVLLVGIPFGGPSVEHEIAGLRGSLIAIGGVAMKKSCEFPIALTPAPEPDPNKRNLAKCRRERTSYGRKRCRERVLGK